jgi:hypothetical protein
MARSTRKGRGLGWAAAMLLLALATTRPAAAGECPRWLPDLHCDRQGRYEGFVAPMASPFLFEDPFITTELSAWGVLHEYPNDSVFQGGEAWAGALQARLAITDRLAFIATKDGYVWHRPDNALLGDERGFLDVAAGLKYALIDRRDRNFILSPSLRVEAPVGGSHVFSGNGDGTLIPALSLGWGIENLHLLGDVGGRIPFDSDEQSTSLFYHLQLDYRLLEHLAPFVALSGYHWTGGGDGSLEVETALGPVSLGDAQALLGTGAFEGVDLVNLGSSGMAGKHIHTLALGLRLPLGEHVSLGLAYEFPISGRRDLFERRTSVNLSYAF